MTTPALRKLAALLAERTSLGEEGAAVLAQDCMNLVAAEAVELANAYHENERARLAAHFRVYAASERRAIRATSNPKHAQPYERYEQLPEQVRDAVAETWEQAARHLDESA